jgi:hypothetical protein
MSLKVQINAILTIKSRLESSLLLNIKRQERSQNFEIADGMKLMSLTFVFTTHTNQRYILLFGSWIGIFLVYKSFSS